MNMNKLIKAAALAAMASSPALADPASGGNVTVINSQTGQLSATGVVGSNLNGSGVGTHVLVNGTNNYTSGTVTIGNEGGAPAFGALGTVYTNNAIVTGRVSATGIVNSDLLDSGAGSGISVQNVNGVDQTKLLINAPASVANSGTVTMLNTTATSQPISGVSVSNTSAFDSGIGKVVVVNNDNMYASDSTKIVTNGTTTPNVGGDVYLNGVTAGNVSSVDVADTNAASSVVGSGDTQKSVNNVNQRLVIINAPSP